MKRKRVKKVKQVKQVRIKNKREGECFICGVTTNLQEHHIIPKCIGGKDLQNNKILLCDECHKKVHQLLDPVIQHMGQAILMIQEELKLERTGGLQAPIGFRSSKHKNGGKK